MLYQWHVSHVCSAMCVSLAANARDAAPTQTVVSSTSAAASSNSLTESPPSPSPHSSPLCNGNAPSSSNGNAFSQVTPKRRNGSGKKNRNGASPQSSVPSLDSLCAASSLPPLSDHSLRETITLLLDEVINGAVAGLELSSSLHGSDRALMHRAAEERGLEHETIGHGAHRHLYITKPYSEKEADQLYLVIRCGHLFIEGVPVDDAGRQYVPDLDDTWRRKREERDGMHHHITLIHGGAIDTLRKEPTEWMKNAAMEAGWDLTNKEMNIDQQTSTKPDMHSSSSLDPVSTVSSPASPSPSASSTAAIPASTAESILFGFFSSHLTTPLTDLGIGRASLDDHAAYFRVLHWPQANELRQVIGLTPVDFHITIGFCQQDVHGVRKDQSTLVLKHEEPGLEEETVSNDDPSTVG